MNTIVSRLIHGSACLTLLGASTPALRAADPPCKPERWNAAIAEFERQDAAAPPPKKGVVFVGSSSVRLWDLK